MSNIQQTDHQNQIMLIRNAKYDATLLKRPDVSCQSVRGINGTYLCN